jgi:hypothetical protein
MIDEQGLETISGFSRRDVGVLGMEVPNYFRDYYQFLTFIQAPQTDEFDAGLSNSKEKLVTHIRTQHRIESVVAAQMGL